jgi:hypothetical protein
MSDPGRISPAQHQAGAFLRAALAGGPRPARQVRAAAREAGISVGALSQARTRLRIRTTRGAGVIWHLPVRYGRAPLPAAVLPHAKKEA